MPKDTARQSVTYLSPPVPLSFNKRRAQQLQGAHVLICFNYLTKNGKLKRQDQQHGTVLSVDPLHGVEIWLGGAVRTITVPADLRAWERAKNGMYTLRASGEEVTNLDYVSEWWVSSNGKQLTPVVPQLARTGNGSYNIYGFGTNFYGRSHRLPDNSYTTTKWVTALYFPLWPLATFRIRDRKPSVSFSMTFASHSAEPLFIDTKQVVCTYLVVLPLAVIFVILAVRI